MAGLGAVPSTLLWGPRTLATMTTRIGSFGMASPSPVFLRTLTTVTEAASRNLASPISRFSTPLGGVLSTMGRRDASIASNESFRRWSSTITREALVGRVEPINPPTLYTPPAALEEKIRSLLTPESKAAISKDLKPLPSSFAVFGLSGKQYKVTQGDVIHTDRLEHVEPGQRIYLDKVLLVGTKENTWLGNPLLPNARVVALVEQQTKAEKIIVFKKKRRKNYRRTKGFRPSITVLRIEEVLLAPEAYPEAPTFRHVLPQPEAPKPTDLTETALRERVGQFRGWLEEQRERLRARNDRKRLAKKGMDSTGVSRYPENSRQRRSEESSSTPTDSSSPSASS